MGEYGRVGGGLGGGPGQLLLGFKYMPAHPDDCLEAWGLRVLLIPFLPPVVMGMRGNQTAEVQDSVLELHCHDQEDLEAMRPLFRLSWQVCFG